MNNLILASSRQNLLFAWKEALGTLAGPINMIGRLDGLLEHVSRAKPAMLLVDLDLLGPDGLVALKKLCLETRIVVIGEVISEAKEWELLKAGVRGCCQGENNPGLLRQVVEAVLLGELWIRRSLTGRLIDELSSASARRETHQLPRGLLNRLTPREYDIAVRVGNGDNNKQIAKSCGVTERTVKAHLTGIFAKLGVTDRLNLALVISAGSRDEMAEMRDPDMLSGFGARASIFKSNMEATV